MRVHAYIHTCLSIYLSLLSIVPAGCEKQTVKKFAYKPEEFVTEVLRALSIQLRQCISVVTADDAGTFGGEKCL